MKRIDNRPRIILGGRQTGKTSRLVMEAYLTNGIIVCPTRKMAKSVDQTAREMGCPIKKSIAYEDFLTNRQRNNNGYYFDEYGISLLNVLTRKLALFEEYGVRDIVIDKGSIDSINSVLDNFIVSDMEGRDLRFEIEILGRNENK